MKSHYKSKRRHEAQYETDDVSLPEQLVKEAGNQAKLVTDNLWEQLLGLDNSSEKQNSGNVVFDLSSLKKSEKVSSGKNGEELEHKKRKTEIQPGIDYHREYYESIAKFSENASSRETVHESRKIQQVMAEIRKLASSTKSLQIEFGLITVEEPPINPGEYYINFFEWMLIMLKQARQKVEDSKSWLETVQGKKKKKAGYWDKAKKHGTTFSQSNERFAATSTG